VDITSKEQMHRQQEQELSTGSPKQEQDKHKWADKDKAEWASEERHK